MALSVLVEWHLPADTPLSRILNRLSLTLSAVLLVFSRSVTPAVALVGTVVFIAVYKVAVRRFRVPLYAIVLATFVMIASGLAVLLVDSERITGALGKSSDLTGRTEIWSGVLPFVGEHPLLGYGYWGFWSGASPDSTVLERLMGTSIMYSHNGYVEILLTLGAVGFVLVLTFLACGIKRAYDCSTHNPFGVDLWPLAFLLFLILHNVGECTILVQDLEWSLCVATVISTDPALFIPVYDQEMEPHLAPNEGLA
jgi:O-antigen ligase